MDHLTKELQQCKEHEAELNIKLNAATTQLEYVNQPHSYLITAIRAKEEELMTGKAIVEIQ